jgi:hypothetical protein
MTEVKPGDLIHVTQQFLPEGTLLELEGKVTALFGDSGAYLDGGFFTWIKDREASSGYIQVTVEVIVPPIDFLPLRPGDIVRCAATTYSVIGDRVYYTQTALQPTSLESVEDFTAWLVDWHRQSQQRAFGLRGRGAELLFRL